MLRERCRDLAALAGYPVPLTAPGVGDRADQPLEMLAREVGAAKERLTVGGHEDSHRPAAMAGHRLRRGHVHGVDVRPFFPVHLDGDQVLVHQRGGRQVLEGFVRHDVAPVAGGIAHRQQHRHIAAACLLEGLPAPGPPVHRVVRVLLQIRARRAH